MVALTETYAGLGREEAERTVESLAAFLRPWRWVLHYLGLMALLLDALFVLAASRIVAMSFCEPRSCIGRLSS